MNRIFKVHASSAWKIVSPSKKAGELSVTCQTHLKEWYAERVTDFWSKETAKGNMVEDENIDFMAQVLGFGIGEKNLLQKEDDHFIGSCDVDYPTIVVDVKSPWDKKTFNDNIYEMNPDYEWQLRVYMPLYGKEEAILFFGLMDTPAELNNDVEVIYSDLPDNERWIAYKIKRDLGLEKALRAKVEECREWLVKYDQFVKKSLGQTHNA